MSTHLYRSRDDRMLAGVAGGLAELWDADPSLVRIIWALLVVFTGGIALVVYIVMAIVVPEEDDARSWAGTDAGPSRPPPSGSGTSATAASTDAPAGSPAPANSAGSGQAGSGPPPAGPTPEYWRQSRFEARAQRREARAARRAARGRDGRSGGIVVGTLLVLLGAWLLVREYLPDINWDWFWPLILVVLGVVVLALAIRPRTDDPGASGGPGGAAGS
jgi:phage shock protein PspC (stress-responsive transcriptional regulator)